MTEKDDKKDATENKKQPKKNSTKIDNNKNRIFRTHLKWVEVKYAGNTRFRKDNE